MVLMTQINSELYSNLEHTHLQNLRHLRQSVIQIETGAKVS